MFKIHKKLYITRKLGWKNWVWSL